MDGLLHQVVLKKSVDGVVLIRLVAECQLLLLPATQFTGNSWFQWSSCARRRKLILFTEGRWAAAARASVLVQSWKQNVK